MFRIAYLECTKCGAHFSADQPRTVCPTDGGVLYVRYDLPKLKHSFSIAVLATRPATMWRYSEVLPDAPPVSLGEGFTPMLASREFANVFIKDEGLNPTGSFKARGMSVAVTMAKAYGLKKLAAPSAGNAASALAAYAAAAGLEAHIFMPRDVPLANRVECESYGAHVTLVDGLISDCARMVAERKEKEGWFDVSTLKEPFRVEGKKTMGYEVAEQFGWKLPQGIIYPTGGGVGLLGMWKAFDEMEALGWIGSERPKMVVVQSAGCAPIVRAFDIGEESAAEFPDAHTKASGLRVPKAIGDFLMLRILRASDGGALAIEDEQMVAENRAVGAAEGLFVAPEGAACFVALKALYSLGHVASHEQVVIFNTGSGIKYLECFEEPR